MCVCDLLVSHPVAFSFTSKCLQILDQQKKAKMEEGDTAALLSASELSFGATGFEDDNDDKSIELGLTSRRKASTKMTAKLSVV